MAPRTRLGHLKRQAAQAKPQVRPSTQAVNTSGFLALADEIYLEIMSHIPSVPIPTITESRLDAEIRRTRQETLRSLSQTSRSLRRVFWRYLWQRIEVRQGIRSGDVDSELEDDIPIPSLGEVAWYKGTNKEYNIELLRQLDFVTVRNPQLAQYVNYLDVVVGNYSLKTVLAELAHCLTLFPNLHTVQIDIACGAKRNLEKVVERIFEGYSYPQIRNLYVMCISQFLIASCPEARRVVLVKRLGDPLRDVGLQPSLEALFNCPHLEVLEDLPELYCTVANCKRIVNTLPNLRTITVTPSAKVGPHIDILNELNFLQTIIFNWDNLRPSHPFGRNLPPERELNEIRRDWTETLKRVLMQVGLRDDLEKTLVLRESWGGDRKMAIKPNKALLK